MTLINRRRFTRYAGALSLAAATAGLTPLLAGCRSSGGNTNAAKGLSTDMYKRLDPRNQGNFSAPLRLPRAEGGAFGMYELTSAPITLTARRSQQEYLGGKKTDTLGYEMQAGGATYVNPVLRVKQGTAVAARLTNEMDEPTIIHWHGMHVDWRNDGHPSYAAARGASYDYSFTVQNRGGTYWYHPHPHTITGTQAYRGLAGFLIVEDDDELRLREALDLVPGVTDIPLLVQDKLFSDSGALIHATTDMERFMGFVGDVVTVNQTVNPVLEADSRVYRLRVLNGSSARTYRLMLARGAEPVPFSLIGTDGGLLARPARVTDVLLAPAERVDLLVDLRPFGPGDTLFLKSGAFDPMHMEMPSMMPSATAAAGGHGGSSSSGSSGGHGGSGGGMMNMAPEPRLPEGTDFSLLKLTVRQRAAYDRALPETLSTITPIAAPAAAPRPLALSSEGMRWLINGQQFDMERDLFRTRTGTIEEWDISNAAMSMPHPMHLHGFLFQVRERRNSPQPLRAFAVDGQNRLATDVGWKDTVLVWPGETVRIAIDFSHTFAGEQLYLVHCHNFEHEDASMMVNYRVV